MIKFTDVLKANVRYFYVLIICMLLFFAIVFGVKFEKANYEAKNDTFYVLNGETTASSSETSDVYQKLNGIMSNSIFYNDVVKKLQTAYPDEFDWLDAKYLESNLKFNYDSKTNVLSASIVGSSARVATLILNTSIEKATTTYYEKFTDKYKLESVYPTTVQKYDTKNAMYAIIGLLVGLVVGEIVITCLVAFLPYVQDKEMLERISGINVLTTLEKEGK